MNMSITVKVLWESETRIFISNTKLPSRIDKKYYNLRTTSNIYIELNNSKFSNEYIMLTCVGKCLEYGTLDNVVQH